MVRDKYRIARALLIRVIPTKGAMIDLYFAPTPNAQKVSIMLEEAELSYHVIGINLLQGDQFTPEFSKINPNHKIPAIVDHHGLGGKQMVLFESGAILMYLAENQESSCLKTLKKNMRSCNG